MDHHRDKAAVRQQAGTEMDDEGKDGYGCETYEKQSEELGLKHMQDAGTNLHVAKASEDTSSIREDEDTGKRWSGKRQTKCCEVPQKKRKYDTGINHRRLLGVVKTQEDEVSKIIVMLAEIASKGKDSLLKKNIVQYRDCALEKLARRLMR